MPIFFLLLPVSDLIIVWIQLNSITQSYNGWVLRVPSGMLMRKRWSRSRKGSVAEVLSLALEST
ncbi:hypothetical protein BKK80_17010 [Cupriavidus malaysiensis]|uniref:Uncharacterized protein n=1 Tax=Cupriavidus malaysiensis TaxID=367825 RepID=A0ABM6F752_9BURK|nr:hypothetical protein BKK80_17010 [Cupriavidus malaysiensis]